MKKVLMILTNARRDCADIALEMLARSGSLPVFDHVAFLLNGVSRAHLRFVDRFIERHPGVAFDKILGPGTRPDGISWMQNQCIEKYPDALYMKIDEDVFVPAGWAERMVDAYERNRERDDLALISPLLPNNAMGLHRLLTAFYPDLLEEHRRLFGRDPDPERTGFTWHSPAVAEWATRTFLRLDEANEAHRRRLAERGIERFFAFHASFSIGCICYDYRHWKKMGGIPRTDEPGWCQWIEEHGQTNLIDQSQVALHYSFFVQQEWLDRTSLVEDLKRANLPDCAGLTDRLQLPRMRRVIRQLPGILQRRLRVARS